MTALVLGLLVFLGAHSVRIVADGWRTRTRERIGAGPWKAAYSAISALGLVAIVWGYGDARLDPVVLWSPPLAALRHLVALFVLVAFVLIAAAYVPGTAIRARLHHPMLLGVKLWAFGHLLVNGTLADLLLFGGFLVWGVFAFRAARQRDRAEARAYPPGRAGPTAAAVAIGAIAWAVFAFGLHRPLIGVAPL
jgi:uncharacterized membrane protein